MQKEKISLAISPDTDDWFMVYAILEKKVDLKNFEFEISSHDIQELNQLAMQKAFFDITAISMGALPKLLKNYSLLKIGASVGDGYGPAIVGICKNAKIENNFDEISKLLQGRRVAVPGLDTSAYLASKILFGEIFTAVPMRFDHIEEAILSGECDFGILIHELQLDDPSNRLRSFSNLGKLWKERFQAPLPLGGIVIKKRFDPETAKTLSDIYRSSIQYALDNRNECIEFATQKALTCLDFKLADEYIKRFVNHNSLDMDERLLKSIDLLTTQSSNFA